MNQRVNELRTTLGLSQELFGQRICLSKTAVSKIENNQSNITDQTIRLICYEFGVCENWLRNGTGKMFATDTDDIIRAMAKKHNLSPEAYIAMETFAKMDEAKQHVLLNYYIDVAAAITAEGLGMTHDQMVAEYRRKLNIEKEGE